MFADFKVYHLPIYKILPQNAKKRIKTKKDPHNSKGLELKNQIYKENNQCKIISIQYSSLRNTRVITNSIAVNIQ
ncbi:MAG: hypothetical protein Tp139SUR343261_3 [Prokaryotic dsDNA virus sp.]|jgi:hypothetical protein|nr:MAG: hypothetical protein Tp139SUR343261_3 [Prokaryotic dsDNA virus sp.]